MLRLAKFLLPVAALTAAAALVPQLAQTLPANASPATSITASYSKPLKKAVKDVGIAKEQRTGYKRDLFEHWIDADKDGCNTRYEVLMAEAVKKPTVRAGCYLQSGKWKSYYDSRATTDPTTFDVDHLVPLAEAWDSGARKWNPDTRKRFANDLADRRTLVAVTAKSNRTKSDSDPAGWVPAKSKCRYAAEWVAVKLRWSLTADAAEHAKLTKYAKSCPTVTVKVKKAAIALDKGNGKDTHTAPVPGVKVFRVQYDAPGSDNSGNTNEEWVEIANTSGAKVSLAGWYVKDAAGARFTFGTFTLGAGAAVKIHSGTGSANPGHVYAGWGHTWNNTGDTAVLYGPDGSKAHTCSYPPNSAGVTSCP